MNLRNWIWLVVVCGLIAGGWPGGIERGLAAEEAAIAADPTPMLFEKTTSRGIAFLRFLAGVGQASAFDRKAAAPTASVISD